jgi:transposase
LLEDCNGFPLGLYSFEGNKAETKTILPVIEAFQAQHGLTKVTVVVDTAILSASNLETLSVAGYTYIVGSRLHKVPYEIAEYQQTGELRDEQIIVDRHEGYRVIYQYQAKRAAINLRNINKQVAKAKKVLTGQILAIRTKFLTVHAKSK